MQCKKKTLWYLQVRQGLVFIFMMVVHTEAGFPVMQLSHTPINDTETSIAYQSWNHFFGLLLTS